VNHKAVEGRWPARALAAGAAPEDPHHMARPVQVPRPDLVRRDFARPRADELWIGDATYIGLMRAGVISRPWWTRARGGCWAGPSPITWARSCAWMRCWAVAACAAPAASPPGSCSIPITARNTPAGPRAACRSLGISQFHGTVGDSYDNAMAGIGDQDVRFERPRDDLVGERPVGPGTVASSHRPAGPASMPGGALTISSCGAGLFIR